MKLLNKTLSSMADVNEMKMHSYDEKIAKLIISTPSSLAGPNLYEFVENTDMLVLVRMLTKLL